MATTLLGSLLSFLPIFNLGIAAGSANISVTTGPEGVGVGILTSIATVGVGVTPTSVGVEVTAPNTAVSVLVTPGSILSGIFGFIKGISNLFTGGGNGDDTDTDTATEKSAPLPEDDADSDAGLPEVSLPVYENGVDLTGTVDPDTADFTLV
ncbi:MAG: hypothetical protein LBE06_07930 [Azoarcus sp.]|jgi:hypothetical protein|nr:hypothetical protein [Azoarcus sp.]